MKLDPMLRRMQQARRLPLDARVEMEKLEKDRWRGVLCVPSRDVRIEIEESRPSRLLAELARRYARARFLARPVIRPPQPQRRRRKSSPK